MIHKFLLGMIMMLAGHVPTWSLCAPLALPRAGYAAGVVNGKWIVAGGSYWTLEGKQRTGATDGFDPQCSCWVGLPAMPLPLSDAASVVVGNTLYVLGGSDMAGTSREVYALEGGRWAHRLDMQLPETRTNGAAVTDGRLIYIVGGLMQTGNYSSGLRSVWVIDPDDTRLSWRRLADFPFDPRISFGAAMLQGKMYIFGGYRAVGVEHRNLNDIWSYDPTTDEWSRAGTLQKGRRALWAVTDSEQIYLFGGYTDTFSADILVYRAGTVRKDGMLPEAVADAKFAAMGCRWYMTGGETGIRIRGKHTWAGTLPEPCNKE